VETLLHIGLSNAGLATVLAVLAAGLGRVCRRPALAHALWVLVLIKLITPPLLAVPVGWPASVAKPASVVPGEPAITDADANPTVREKLPPPSLQRRAEVAEPVVTPLVGGADVSLGLPELSDRVVQAVPDTSPRPLIVPRPRQEAASGSWEAVIVVIWLFGSALWFSAVAVRVCRFRRLLRYARPASPELLKQAQRLAGRLGLRWCPGVWLVPAPISPMLWWLGSAPRILLPAMLWDRLGGDQQECLLAHELGHLRRRDHWVRVLECVAAGLYWWDPVVWWARRELRAAEEACCDAWVVWSLPSAAKAYALAIVETLAFLSTSRCARPAGASGMGQVPSLQRRLTMIMRGTTPRALTWRGLLAVLGLGAVLLPWLPTWAQQATPPAPPAQPPTSAPAAPVVLEQRDAKQEKVLGQEQRALLDTIMRLEVRRAQVQKQINETTKLMQDQKEEMSRLSEKLDEVKRKLAQSEGRPVSAATSTAALPYARYPLGPAKPSLPPYTIKIGDVLQVQAFQTIPERPLNGPHRVLPDGRLRMAFYGSVSVVGFTLDEAEQIITNKLAERIRNPEVSVNLLSSSEDAPVSGASRLPDPQRRPRDLDKRLEAVLREVESLRQELQQFVPTSAAPQSSYPPQGARPGVTPRKAN
jgi:beta-lactamase regulating signal transducer with metallopeptidase domain